MSPPANRGNQNCIGKGRNFFWHSTRRILAKLKLILGSQSRSREVKTQSLWNYELSQALPNSGGRAENKMKRVRYWSRCAVGLTKGLIRPMSGGRATCCRVLALRASEQTKKHAFSTLDAG